MRPHRRQPTTLPRPWDSPGKNTGVGCHFLLQCMKVKSEREVAQSCPTLCDPMHYSLPGSSVHGIFQASVLEWGAITFSRHTHIHTHIYICIYLPILPESSIIHAKSLQSHPMLCNTMDCSPPGSSVHGILQARESTSVGCQALLQGISPTRD